MKINKSYPQMPGHIFWDVDVNEETFKNYPGFVIVRVFERGDIPEIKILRQYYGDDIIRKEIVEAKYIEPETLNFLSALYDIAKTNFKCYTPTL